MLSQPVGMRKNSKVYNTQVVFKPLLYIITYVTSNLTLTHNVCFSDPVRASIIKTSDHTVSIRHLDLCTKSVSMEM